MYCTKKIREDLFWIGGNDRRLSLFEGVYSVPKGVSYNSYILKDDKIVIFDTVDKAVGEVFFENLEAELDGKQPDYIVVHHMEPDHSATLKQLLYIYPKITIVCSQKIQDMINQFFDFKTQPSYIIVKEGDTLKTGKHELAFVMAPMVHWPEVMVSYDKTDKILFSADAFGCFGALNGAIFADEVDFEHDYMDEARRYYCNIVGKYGTQVQALLKKAAALDIEYICPLHGFVWRRNLGDFIDKYQKWSTYTPEENGVLLAYASVYGHTAAAAEVVAARLQDAGIKTEVFDVSVTPASEIISAAFKYSHFIFASTTYNAGIFVTMDEFLRDLAAHNIQNRTIGIIENGSWAATAGKLMKEIFANCKNITFMEKTLSIKSSFKSSQTKDLDEFINEMKGFFITKPESASESSCSNQVIENTSFFKISYGLYLVSAKDEKDNACIINTAQQVTDMPKKISITVNKANYTHDMILKTKKFNLSVLTEETPFTVFERFGFHCGRNVNKFESTEGFARSSNGLLYMTDTSNAFISATVTETVDCGTHTLFIATVDESKTLSDKASVTYDYYFKHIKPKPKAADEKKKGFVCKICGYFYEGETLPPDFICPLCKHGVQDFEPVG